MALSNIGKEPIREINETLVGLAAAIVLIALDVMVTYWIMGKYDEGANLPPYGVSFALLLVWVPAAVVLMGGLVSLLINGIHSLGESICNTLQAHGIHLRPVRPKPEPRLYSPEARAALDALAKAQRPMSNNLRPSYNPEANALPIFQANPHA